MSLEENKAIVRKMFEAINTQSLASLDMLMAPDFVLHMHAQQAQGWEVNGLAPTGNKLSYSVVAIWRIVEGKIIEGWITYDQMDFLQQLGVIEWKGFPDEAT